jgi:hypothetical protein
VQCGIAGPIIIPLIVHDAANAPDIEPADNAVAAKLARTIRMSDGFRRFGSAKRKAPARSADCSGR